MEDLRWHDDISMSKNKSHTNIDKEPSGHSAGPYPTPPNIHFPAKSVSSSNTSIIESKALYGLERLHLGPLSKLRPSSSAARSIISSRGGSTLYEPSIGGSTLYDSSLYGETLRESISDRTTGLGEEAHTSLKTSCSSPAKPVFFCTFCCELGTRKTFGTKHDWKRHEKEFHETEFEWHCPSLDCEEIFARERDFKHHNEKFHGSRPDPRANKLVPPKKAVYACGFEGCRKLTTNWKERCDHIARHMRDEGPNHWSYTMRIRNLLRHPHISPTWKLIKEHWFGRLGIDSSLLKWDPIRSRNLRVQLECHSFGPRLEEFLLKVLKCGLSASIKSSGFPIPPAGETNHLCGDRAVSPIFSPAKREPNEKNSVITVDISPLAALEVFKEERVRFPDDKTYRDPLSPRPFLVNETSPIDGMSTQVLEKRPPQSFLELPMQLKDHKSKTYSEDSPGLDNGLLGNRARSSRSSLSRSRGSESSTESLQESLMSDEESIIWTEVSESFPEWGHATALIDHLKKEYVTEAVSSFATSKQWRQKARDLADQEASEGPNNTGNRKHRASSPPHDRCQGRPAKRLNRGIGSTNGDGRDEEQEEDDNRRDRTPWNGPAKGPMPLNDVLFACPFVKRYPHRYLKCFSHTLKDVSRVKQHLFRDKAHRLPIYCPICYGTFSQEDQRDEHVREALCARRPPITWEGITTPQRKQLSRRSSSTQTAEENWYDVFRILFPGEPLPSSPYIEVNLSGELRAFREHMLVHGQRIWNELLESRLPDHLKSHSDELRLLNESFFSEAVSRLCEDWNTRCATNPPPHSISSGRRNAAISLVNPPVGISAPNQNLTMVNANSHDYIEQRLHGNIPISGTGSTAVDSGHPSYADSPTLGTVRPSYQPIQSSLHGDNFGLDTSLEFNNCHESNNPAGHDGDGSTALAWDPQMQVSPAPICQPMQASTIWGSYFGEVNDPHPYELLTLPTAGAGTVGLETMSGYHAL